MEGTTRWRETIFVPCGKESPRGVRARAVVERLGETPRLDALWACRAPPHSPRARLLSARGQRMHAVVLEGHPP